MKISYAWLRELVAIDPTKISAENVGNRLTLHTAELEEIVEMKSLYDSIIVGKLLEISDHESGELKITQFDLGKRGKAQIVYKPIHELTIGNCYPIAIPGATLPNGMTINSAKVRGTQSEGMICDNTELGMKNDQVMTFPETHIGKPLSEISAEFRDEIFDIDNKSLTHRPDLMGHRGFARELSAIFDTETAFPEFSEIADTAEKQTEKISAEIISPYCRRFTALKVSGLTVTPSAQPFQLRLENLGTRAISNVVDITNLVMLEHGQPMHAFDAQKIRGKIIVRQADNGEKLLALDGETYELTADDLVIADEEKILSIAGIMGGMESSVTDDTTDIVFESANFDPTVIRQTSARLGLRSESSMRFEKSLDPENCLNGLRHAAHLAIDMSETAKITSQITDIYPAQNEFSAESVVILDPRKVRTLSGLEISDPEIKHTLEKLGFKITNDWEITIPSFRATKDVSIQEDLIEEVVRLHGYDDIPSVLPSLPVTPPRENKLRQLEWKIRGILSARDFLEVYHTSFVAPNDMDFTGLKESDYVSTQNFASAEMKYLRTTLISNFIRQAETELRSHGEMQLFEINKTYHAPFAETQKLALVIGSMKAKNEVLFSQIGDELRHLLKQIGFPRDNVRFQVIKNPRKFFHPHQCAEIFIENQSLGYISTLHPNVNPVKKSQFAFAEIDLDALIQIASKSEVGYAPASQFPSIYRDLSLVVDKRIAMADICKTAKKSAENLVSIKLFDDYQDDEKLGQDVKNLAFHLRFQSHDQTLAGETIEAESDAIIASLEIEFGAQLRKDFDEK